ncbi:MAG: site-specific recombinase, phage integrase family domain protein [Marinobacter sp. T13-3]|nr:MAG: site-specific recombinase, phage integrase family domain protein [Marinobacter sp. T13-3]
MTLPNELAFLQEYLEGPSNRYDQAEWLYNSFGDPIWSYNFDFKRGPQYLDWNVDLSNDTSLTDSENAELLNSLKHWLIASTEPQAGGVSNSVKVQYAEFNRTLHVIDYLIMNDEVYKISSFGLASLSADDLKDILTKIASSPVIHESLFTWTTRLIEFTQKLLKETPADEINEILAEVEGIARVNPDHLDEARSLGLDPELIPSLKAALHRNGFMTRNKRLGFAPNSALISLELYKNTTKVKYIDKPALPIFSYTPSTDYYSREFNAVGVTTGEAEETLSPVVYARYVNSLYRMGILHELNISAPEVVDLLSIKAFRVDLKNMGRFRTLPSEVVFGSVKNAIDFHFNHGRDILNGFLRLAILAKKLGCGLGEVPQQDFDNAIGPRLKDLGISELGDRFSSYKSFVKRNHIFKLSKPDHFKAFRNNRWLLPLVYVYFGAVQLVVGALTARRVGELNELMVGKALDSTETWLLFQNRKSTRGLMGLRSTEARPIEPIGTTMLKELDRFQRILNRIGYGKKVNFIFSSPSTASGNCRISASAFSFNKHLDLFCDYFETPLNHQGRRYYIRQHQLRRFFALLFFYSNSFGGLETLQWMMGHTDLRHVWHYITESMTGEVLRGAKSQFVAESLHYGGGDSYKDLADLLQKRYGTKDFTLLDTEELEDYITALLEEDEIEIEPEFFTDPDGQKFKVIVKIKDSSGH